MGEDAENSRFLGLGSLAYLSEVAEDNLAEALKTKINAAAAQKDLDALDAYVGEIPEGYTEENVIAYINKKAEETLNAASGGSSESAASVLAALNTYQTTTDPRLEALEAVDHEHGNKAVLDTITAENVAAWDAAEQNAKDYADSLAKNYDAAGAAQAVQDKLDEEVTRAKAAEEANATAAAGALTAAQNAQKAADEAAGAAATAQDEIDALELVVGTPDEGKTVVQMIKDIPAYDDAEVRGLISDNADAIDALEQAHAADKADLQTQINTIMNNPDTEGVINSINEFTQYINEHGEIAEGFRQDIDATAQAIADHEELAAETYETKTHANDLNTAMDTRVKVLEAIDHEAYKAYADQAEADAIAHADELNGAMDTRVKVVEGKAHEHTNKALLDTYTQTEADLADAVAKKHEHANAEELAKIASGDVAKWNAAQANAEATAAAALASARTEISAEIDADVKALADGAVATNASNIAANADAIALKANAADVYAKTETYTQAQVDAAIEAAVTEANTWGEF